MATLSLNLNLIELLWSWTNIFLILVTGVSLHGKIYSTLLLSKLFFYIKKAYIQFYSFRIEQLMFLLRIFALSYKD